MNIGIDIDNVISNFDDELLKEYLIHDKKLRGARNNHKIDIVNYIYVNKVYNDLFQKLGG